MYLVFLDFNSCKSQLPKSVLHIQYICHILLEGLPIGRIGRLSKGKVVQKDFSPEGNIVGRIKNSPKEKISYSFITLSQLKHFSKRQRLVLQNKRHIPTSKELKFIWGMCLRKLMNKREIRLIFWEENSISYTQSFQGKSNVLGLQESSRFFMSNPKLSPSLSIEGIGNHTCKVT